MSDTTPELAPCPGEQVGGKRRSRRSEPRPDELELLRRCSTGPRLLVDGPVGRCTKHGWLRPVIEARAARTGSQAVVLYELTPAGRTAIGSALGSG